MNVNDALIDLLPIFAGAAVLSAGSVALLLPLLRRHAIARPNARSSHTIPTPQGGGIAVIGATIITAVAAAVFLLPIATDDLLRLTAVFAAALVLAGVGAFDDIRPIEAVPRLFLQSAAVVLLVAVLPAELRIVPMLPWWIERALLFVGVLWFVNLVNFMDGIDWMTVAQTVPMTAALAVFGVTGALPGEAILVAVALCAAIVGFAPFNRPVARLFLGDVGSLPLGLLLAWLLIVLAGRGHLAAALLLPLYYITDATVTLLWRLARRQPVMKAHRTHFYQRARDRGFDVYDIVARVFAVNCVLAGLAAVTLTDRSPAAQAIALAAGLVLVATLLWSFNRGKG
jgi:UDP-N-acetylmuramyl pentapeptide phosphotransferase/UDP-N-acetylglucosamine-1-phosphate transferase